MAENVVGKIGVELDTSSWPRDVAAGASRAQASIRPIRVPVDGAPLGRITADLKEFDKSLGAANARVIAFGATTGVLYSIAAGFRDLVGSTINVEKALTGIQAVLHTTGAGFAELRNSIFDIAKDTGSSFNQVAEAVQDFSRQGLSLDETLKRTKDTMILVRQSGLGIKEAIEVVTSSINEFQNQAIDSTTAVNKLINVGNSFAVTSSGLGEALSKSAAAANEAGVSFDQLIAIVTSLQQTTGRSATTVSLAFRNILNRTEKNTTLEALDQVGVRVRSLSGEVLPAVEILKNLSAVYGTLTDSQQRFVNETVAGVRQGDVLRALLSDLGKENGTYSRALQQSLGTTDEATKRNEELNTSLSALINKTRESGTALASAFGTKAIEPGLKSLFQTVNTLFESVGGKSQGQDSIGAKIGSGIIDGIGTALKGPGTVVISALLFSIFGKVLGKAGETIGELTGLNKNARLQEETQVSINRALSAGTGEYRKQYEAATTVAERHDIILKAIQAENAALEVQRGLYAQEAATLLSQGIRPTGGNIPGKRGQAFEASYGYIPNADSGLLPSIIREKMAVQRGAGGAFPTAQPVVVPNFNFGGGKSGSIIANTNEYIVKNFIGGQGSAVFNPRMINQIGGFNNLLSLGRVEKIASEGYVPSFAKTDPKIQIGIPEGMIEEGLHTEYPDVANLLEQYTHFGKPKGIYSALEHPRYPEYYADLQRLLKRSYGSQSIPVSRIEGYGAFDGRGVGEYVSVSTNPNWGASKPDKVKKYSIDYKDVIAAGGEAEGELIVKRTALVPISKTSIKSFVKTANQGFIPSFVDEDNQDFVPNLAVSIDSLKQGVKYLRNSRPLYGEDIYLTRNNTRPYYAYGVNYKEEPFARTVNIPKGTRGETVLHEISHAIRHIRGEKSDNILNEEIGASKQALSYVDPEHYKEARGHLNESLKTYKIHDILQRTGANNFTVNLDKFHSDAEKTGSLNTNRAGLSFALREYIKSIGKDEFLDRYKYVKDSDLTARLAEGMIPDYADLNSEQFKKWFGESKVVNREGSPRIVYHGTQAPVFSEFDTNRENFMLSRNIGTHFATAPKMTDPFTIGQYARPSDFVVANNPENSWYRDWKTGGELRYDGIELLTKRKDYSRKTLGPLLEKHSRFPQYKLGQEYGTDMIKPGGKVYPVYLSIQNPLVVKTGVSDDAEVSRAIAREVLPKDRQLFIDSVTHSVGFKKEEAEQMWEDFAAGRPSGRYQDMNDLIRNYTGLIPDKFSLQAKQILQKSGYDGIKYQNTSNNEKVKTGSNAVYIAFEPTQIKSAISNSGAFDPLNPDITRARGFIPDYADELKGRKPVEDYLVWEPQGELAEYAKHLNTIPFDKDTIYRGGSEAELLQLLKGKTLKSDNRDVSKKRPGTYFALDPGLAGRFTLRNARDTGSGFFLEADKSKIDNLTERAEALSTPHVSTEAIKRILLYKGGKIQDVTKKYLGNLADGLIPDYAETYIPFNFNLESFFGTAAANIKGKTADLGDINTFVRGQGHSKFVYEDLVKALKEKGVNNIQGSLIPQQKNLPRGASPVDALKALYPQIIRGRFGKTSVLGIGDKEFHFTKENFDEELIKHANSILEEARKSGAKPPFLTSYLAGGYLPNLDQLRRNNYSWLDRHGSFTPVDTSHGDVAGRLMKGSQNLHSNIQKMWAAGNARVSSIGKDVLIANIEGGTTLVDNQRKALIRQAEDFGFKQVWLDSGSNYKTIWQNPTFAEGFMPDYASHDPKDLKGFANFGPPPEGYVPWRPTEEEVAKIKAGGRITKAARWDNMNPEDRLNILEKHAPGIEKNRKLADKRFFDLGSKLGWNNVPDFAEGFNPNLELRQYFKKAIKLPNGEVKAIRKGEMMHSQIYDRLIAQNHPNVLGPSDPDIEDGFMDFKGKFYTKDELRDKNLYRDVFGEGMYLKGKEITELEKANFVDGFMPNYVDTLLGEGRYGKFFDLDKKYQGVRLGRKDFTTPVQSIIGDELETGKVLRKAFERGLFPPGIEFPKVFGSKESSIQKRSIFKEVVPGVSGEGFLSKYTESDDSTFDRATSLMNSLRDRVSGEFYDLGLYPSDIHEGNFILNNKMEKAFHNLLKNPDNAKAVDEHYEEFNKFYDASVKQGGKVTVIDPGSVMLKGSRTYLSAPPKNILDTIIQQSPFGKNQGFAQGLIPDYANTDRFIEIARKIKEKIIRYPSDEYIEKIPEGGYLDDPKVKAYYKGKDQFESFLQKAVLRGIVNYEDLRHGDLDILQPSFKELGTDIDRFGQVTKLPERLFHVTTNFDAVKQSGVLKSRNELAMTSGTGLGGGPDDTVSFTTDRKTARGIQRSTIELASLLSGKRDPSFLFERAKQGYKAQKPFDKEFSEYAKGVVGRDKFEAFQTGQLVVSDALNQKTAEEIKDLGGTPIKGFNNNKFFRYSVPFKPTTYDIHSLHSAYSYAQEGAGGFLNPLFFTSDYDKIAKLNLKDVRLLEGRPKFAADKGMKVSALGEYRVLEGKRIGLNLNKGFVPSYAIIPGISQLAGRVATNLTDPFGYNIYEKLQELSRQKPKDIFSAILKDKPVQDDSKWWKGTSESRAIRDFAFRKMFGLGERFLEPAPGLPASKIDVGKELLTQTGKKTFAFKPETEAYREVIKTVLKSSTGGGFDHHPVMAGFDASVDVNKRKISYKDVWDVALNQGETTNLSSAVKELRELKNKGLQGAYDSARINDASYGSSPLSNLLRQSMTKITDPVTFSGNIYIPRQRDQDRLARLASSVQQKGNKKLFDKTMAKFYDNANLMYQFENYKDDELQMAQGFIPSFNNPLKEAIQRESRYVDRNSIYVDQDSRLSNNKNPLGLLVANKRDEPDGGFEGVSRAIKEGRNPQTYGAAHGFIPNLAEVPSLEFIEKLMEIRRNLSTKQRQAQDEYIFRTAQELGIPFNKKDGGLVTLRGIQREAERKVAATPEEIGAYRAPTAPATYTPPSDIITPLNEISIPEPLSRSERRLERSRQSIADDARRREEAKRRRERAQTSIQPENTGEETEQRQRRLLERERQIEEEREAYVPGSLVEPYRNLSKSRETEQEKIARERNSAIVAYLNQKKNKGRGFANLSTDELNKIEQAIAPPAPTVPTQQTEAGFAGLSGTSQISGGIVGLVQGAATQATQQEAQLKQKVEAQTRKLEEERGRIGNFFNKEAERSFTDRFQSPLGAEGIKGSLAALFSTHAGRLESAKLTPDNLSEQGQVVVGDVEAARRASILQRRSQLALGASFIAPPLIQGIAEGAGLNPESRTGRAFGGIIGGVSTGTSIAALAQFSKFGIGLGVVVGAFTGLKAITDNVVKSFDTISKSIDESNNKRQAEATAISATTQAITQFAEISRSGDKGAIARSQTQIQQLLPAIPKEFREQFINSAATPTPANIDKLLDIQNKVQLDQFRNKQAGDVAKELVLRSDKLDVAPGEGRQGIDIPPILSTLLPGSQGLANKINVSPLGGNPFSNLAGTQRDVVEAFTPREDDKFTARIAKFAERARYSFSTSGLGDAAAGGGIGIQPILSALFPGSDALEKVKSRFQPARLSDTLKSISSIPLDTEALSQDKSVDLNQLRQSLKPSGGGNPLQIIDKVLKSAKVSEDIIKNVNEGLSTFDEGTLRVVATGFISSAQQNQNAGKKIADTSSNLQKKLSDFLSINDDILKDVAHNFDIKSLRQHGQRAIGLQEAQGQLQIAEPILSSEGAENFRNKTQQAQLADEKITTFDNLLSKAIGRFQIPEEALQQPRVVEQVARSAQVLTREPGQATQELSKIADVLKEFDAKGGEKLSEGIRKGSRELAREFDTAGEQFVIKYEEANKTHQLNLTKIQFEQSRNFLGGDFRKLENFDFSPLVRGIQSAVQLPSDKPIFGNFFDTRTGQTTRREDVIAERDRRIERSGSIAELGSFALDKGLIPQNSPLRGTFRQFEQTAAEDSFKNFIDELKNFIPRGATGVAGQLRAGLNDPALLQTAHQAALVQSAEKFGLTSEEAKASNIPLIGALQKTVENNDKLAAEGLQGIEPLKQNTIELLNTSAKISELGGAADRLVKAIEENTAAQKTGKPEEPKPNQNPPDQNQTPAPYNPLPPPPPSDTTTGARGFIPNFNAFLKEARDIALGVGGARLGDKPMMLNLMGLGPSVINSGESVVKNFLGTNKDAVFNREMKQSFGLPLDLLGNKSRGYVPNFQDIDNENVVVYNPDGSIDKKTSQTPLQAYQSDLRRENAGTGRNRERHVIFNQPEESLGGTIKVFDIKNPTLTVDEAAQKSFREDRAAQQEGFRDIAQYRKWKETGILEAPPGTVGESARQRGEEGLRNAIEKRRIILGGSDSTPELESALGKRIIVGGSDSTPTARLEAAYKSGSIARPIDSNIVERGNIDLTNRPVVKNKDGSISTVRSISTNIDGKEVLIPTVERHGRGILSNQSAIQQYKQTGQHLGIFNSIESANAYGRELHQEQSQRYIVQPQRVDAYSRAGLTPTGEQLIKPRIDSAYARAGLTSTGEQIPIRKVRSESPLVQKPSINQYLPRFHQLIPNKDILNPTKRQPLSRLLKIQEGQFPFDLGAARGYIPNFDSEEEINLNIARAMESADARRVSSETIGLGSRLRTGHVQGSGGLRIGHVQGSGGLRIGHVQSSGGLRTGRLSMLEDKETYVRGHIPNFADDDKSIAEIIKSIKENKTKTGINAWLEGEKHPDPLTNEQRVKKWIETDKQIPQDKRSEEEKRRMQELARGFIPNFADDKKSWPWWDKIKEMFGKKPTAEPTPAPKLPTDYTTTKDVQSMLSQMDNQANGFIPNFATVSEERKIKSLIAWVKKHPGQPAYNLPSGSGGGDVAPYFGQVAKLISQGVSESSIIDSLTAQRTFPIIQPGTNQYLDPKNLPNLPNRFQMQFLPYVVPPSMSEQIILSSLEARQERAGIRPTDIVEQKVNGLIEKYGYGQVNEFFKTAVTGVDQYDYKVKDYSYDLRDVTNDPNASLAGQGYYAEGFLPPELQKSISRETNALSKRGVRNPIDYIFTGRSSGIFGVGNTIDEKMGSFDPNLGIQQGVNRYMRAGLNPNNAGSIPNYADGTEGIVQAIIQSISRQSNFRDVLGPNNFVGRRDNPNAGSSDNRALIETDNQLIGIIKNLIDKLTSFGETLNKNANTNNLTPGGNDVTHTGNFKVDVNANVQGSSGIDQGIISQMQQSIENFKADIQDRLSQLESNNGQIPSPPNVAPAGFGGLFV